MYAYTIQMYVLTIHFFPIIEVMGREQRAKGQGPEDRSQTTAVRNGVTS